MDAPDVQCLGHVSVISESRPPVVARVKIIQFRRLDVSPVLSLHRTVVQRSLRSIMKRVDLLLDRSVGNIIRIFGREAIPSVSSSRVAGFVHLVRTVFDRTRRIPCTHMGQIAIAEFFNEFLSGCIFFLYELRARSILR